MSRETFTEEQTTKNSSQKLQIGAAFRHLLEVGCVWCRLTATAIETSVEFRRKTAKLQTVQTENLTTKVFRSSKVDQRIMMLRVGLFDLSSWKQAFGRGGSLHDLVLHIFIQGPDSSCTNLLISNVFYQVWIRVRYGRLGRLLTPVLKAWVRRPDIKPQESLKWFNLILNDQMH